MAGRSRDTYKKRQKEVARAEKQREKAARRLDRKLHKDDPETGEAGDASEDNLDHLDRLDLDDLDKEAAGIEPLREVGPS
jgi:DNA-binding MarR family transcriptional regulator